MKQDKDKLLDYIEKNDQKHKKVEETLKQAESDTLRYKLDFEYYKRKFEELQKAKTDMDDLLVQAKLNLQDMRDQK